MSDTGWFGLEYIPFRWPSFCLLLTNSRAMRQFGTSHAVVALAWQLKRMRWNQWFIKLQGNFIQTCRLKIIPAVIRRSLKDVPHPVDLNDLVITLQGPVLSQWSCFEMQCDIVWCFMWSIVNWWYDPWSIHIHIHPYPSHFSGNNSYAIDVPSAESSGLPRNRRSQWLLWPHRDLIKRLSLLARKG